LALLFAARADSLADTPRFQQSPVAKLLRLPFVD
jgi:hypothetical protein